jgi:hypothetical protein
VRRGPRSKESLREIQGERGTKTGNLSGARALNVAPKRTANEIEFPERLSELESCDARDGNLRLVSKK